VKLIPRLVGLCAGLSAILFFLRFAVPQISICRISGEGSRMTTVCGMIKFTGDDFLSIYRVSLVNTPWRSK